MRTRALFALTFTLACQRFGYETRLQATDSTLVGPDDSAVVGDASPPDLGAPGTAVDPPSTPDVGPTTEGGLDGGPAEPANAGRLDAGTHTAPIDLCPERSDALFCDGFEDPSFSRWSYPVITNGSVEQSTTFVHAGTGSMHANTGSSGANNVARYAAAIFDQQMSGDIWVRAYYYLPSSTEVTTSLFSTLVVSEIEPPYFGFALIVRSSRVDIGVLDTMYPGTLAFPRDRWTCIELHVTIDPEQGVFEGFLDGELAAQSLPTDTQPDHGYTVIDAGIHYTEPEQGPVELYVDDVVAGTSRVGCD
jgi:hypothetical protein